MGLGGNVLFLVTVHEGRQERNMVHLAHIWRRVGLRLTVSWGMTQGQWALEEVACSQA
jgi:hypothetical protein